MREGDALLAGHGQEPVVTARIASLRDAGVLSDFQRSIVAREPVDRGH